MDVSRYLDLIAAFLCGDISARDFEGKYLQMFKDDPRIFPNELYEVLNKLFTDLDVYCDDSTLRQAGELDEDELRECAEMAYAALTNIAEGGAGPNSA